MSNGSRRGRLPSIVEEQDDDEDEVGEMKLSREHYEGLVPGFKYSEGASSGGSSGESSAEEMKLSRENYPSELPSMAAQSESPVFPEMQQPMPTTPEQLEPSVRPKIRQPMPTTPEQLEPSVRPKIRQPMPTTPEQTEPSVSPKIRQPMFGMPEQTEPSFGQIMREPRSSTSFVPGRSSMGEPSTAELSPAQPKRIQILRRPESHRFEPPARAEVEPGLQFTWDHFASEFQPTQDMSGLSEMFGEGDDTEDEAEDDDDDDGLAREVFTISSNIIRDLKELKDVGYDIDYPNGLLGEGYFGAVYQGTYGPEARNLIRRHRFAVKIVEFGAKRDRDTRERRERYETEKFIMTNALHKNIVPIRMIINMGKHRSFPFIDNPNRRYISPERVYLIMDFADEGELQTFLDRHRCSLETYQIINWIRDLFAGMLYLHCNDIVHGDVHTGNVLLFKEEGEVVAKWADFGLGFVGSDKQYHFRAPDYEDMAKKFQKDLEGMSFVFKAILAQKALKRRSQQMGFMSDMDAGMSSIFGPMRPQPPRQSAPKQSQTKEEQSLKILDNMCKTLKTAHKLIQVYEQYKHILEDELELAEQYFK